MTIKILKSRVIHGRPGVAVGDILEVPNDEGWSLIQARIAKETKVYPPAPPEPVQVREPEVENRDPVIEKPKRSKKSLP
jgi:hypothetical protein